MRNTDSEGNVEYRGLTSKKVKPFPYKRLNLGAKVATDK